MKIKGLKRVVGRTKGLQGPYGMNYVVVYYDTYDNTCWCHEYADFGRHSYAHYENDTIHMIGMFDRPVTMVELAHRIEWTLQNPEYPWNYYGLVD